MCMGSGILSCYSEFAGDTCSACSTADCLSTFNTCQQSCTHPGCSCNLDLGTCEGVSGTKSPSTVRCTGSPLSCGQLETKTSCDLAQNCIWVVDTEPDGLCRGGGSDISSCSALFPSFTFSVCDYLPLNEYTVCLRDCTHPGCECKVDSGVCNIGPIFVGGTSTLRFVTTRRDLKSAFIPLQETHACCCCFPFSCTGTPTKCSDIKTEQSCTQAPGCFWEMSTAPEPTYCDSDVDVDIDLKCMNDDNLACSMIHPPRDTKCATGESIFTLVFSYQASACALESNQQLDNADCEDTGNINPSSNVKIVCVDADQVSRAIDVEPNVVGRGDRVRITNPSVGPLPKRLSCAIADSTNNVILQGVVLDTSGNVQLDLKDKYGALQLEGCDSKKCFDRWTFTSSVKNIGTTDLVLRQFELDVAFESSSDPVNLLDGSVNPLLPVGSATAGIDQVRTVDLCGAGNLGANASAVVATAAGIPGSCNFSEALVLPNQPDCNLNMSLTCSGHGDAAKELQGVACQNFVGEPEQRCKCPDCARELRFRYTGELCGPNVPGAKCRNVTSAMPHSAARVLIRRGYTDMLDVPRVEVGRDVIFRNRGGCLPNDFTMFAMRVGTSIVSQQVDIVTNCNNVGIPLMGSFGGFNFSGYSCNDTNVHNCFVDVAHNACIENDGTATRVLESFMLDVTGTSTEVFNLLDGTNANDRQLTAGEKYCDTRITQIKLCTNNTKYTTIASAGVGTLCPDAGVVSQGLNFSIFGSGVRPPPPEDIEPEDPSSPDGCPTGPVSVFDPPPPPGCTRKQ